MPLETNVMISRLGGSADGQKFQARGNEYNEQLIAQGLPAYTEMSRRGAGYTVHTATLFAPLTAVPTTTAALELWNNTASGKDMVVDTLYAEQILSTAATQTYAIYAQVAAVKAVPTLTALTLFSLSGQAAVVPTVGTDVVTGIGTTVVANGWRPWGGVQAWGTAAATPGNSWSVDINGRLLVPPGCSLCLHIVGSLATASTFHVGASFYLVDITAE